MMARRFLAAWLGLALVVGFGSAPVVAQRLVDTIPSPYRLEGDIRGVTGGITPLAYVDFTAGSVPAWLTFSRPSSGTYQNASGVIATATNNAARFDYASGTAKGLLAEASATNLVLQSADVSNASWIKLGTNVAAPAVTANFAVAPDGTTTAAKVVFPAVSASNARSFVTQQVSSSLTAASYRWTPWLKGAAGGETIYVFALNNAASIYYRQLVTLTTSWVRYPLPLTATAVQWYFAIGTDRALDAGQSATAGGTVYVWNLQAELGTRATSDIVTAGATATRAADALAQSTYASNAQIWEREALATGTVDRVYYAGGAAPATLPTGYWYTKAAVYGRDLTSPEQTAKLVVGAPL